MDDKEILLKAFEIMVDNSEKGRNICDGIVCSLCPFVDWYICPNGCKEGL